MNNKELKAKHISSINQLADVLTKALLRSQFDNLILKIGVADHTPNLWEDNRDKSKSAPTQYTRPTSLHVTLTSHQTTTDVSGRPVQWSTLTHIICIVILTYNSIVYDFNNSLIYI